LLVKFVISIAELSLASVTNYSNLNSFSLTACVMLNVSGATHTYLFNCLTVQLCNRLIL